MRAGARGYLLKDADKDEVVRAIVAVERGEAIFSPAIAQRMIQYFSAPSTSPSKKSQPDEFSELTERELEILNLIAKGDNNNTIANKLSLSIKTVQNYVSSILTKLQVTDRAQAIVRARDYTQLRDVVRNWPPGDLALALTDLPLEEQVVVFRILPRKDAAATFEYLSIEQQEALLKAMAQEDVASLLNEMAPDDRTMFLEELPAPVTRQLLALLTPEERAIASTLLGYPESSIGRLMTPAYIAVEEHWTIQQVLDFIREHGQDSETLNVIYIVDDQGRLIDDLRIRELLLAQPSKRVADLMDRRFVSLKATDDQAGAIIEFREHDRTALPVTDTAGILIGIVTIDDVLDVAEARTTGEIQRIGGSEALDEPYMDISFRRCFRSVPDG